MHEGLTLIGAGLLTTAHVLSRTTYHVLANPKIHKRVQKELQEAMPSSWSPSSKENLLKLENLPYLNAIIKEGLRLSNPISHRIGRVAPDRALTFNDWVIPPGTVVNMSMMLLHGDPAVFSEPEKFDPERWLRAPDARGVNPLEKYLLPYNRGSRMCLGMNLADAELRMTLAAIFQRFDLALYETTRSDATVVHDYIAGSPRADSKGIRVVVQQRT